MCLSLLYVSIDHQQTKTKSAQKKPFVTEFSNLLSELSLKNSDVTIVGDVNLCGPAALRASLGLS